MGIITEAALVDTSERRGSKQKRNAQADALRLQAGYDSATERHGNPKGGSQVKLLPVD